MILELLHIAEQVIYEDESNTVELPQEVEKKKRLYPGDVIFVERMGGLYRHYGLYIGKEKVIHYASNDGDFGETISIHEDTLTRFLSEAERCYICKFPAHAPVPGYHRFTKQEALERAYQRLGETEYDLIHNNCEHFAIWCRTNISESLQVRTLERAMTLFIRLIESLTENDS